MDNALSPEQEVLKLRILETLHDAVAQAVNDLHLADTSGVTLAIVHSLMHIAVNEARRCSFPRKDLDKIYRVVLASTYQES